ANIAAMTDSNVGVHCFRRFFFFRLLYSDLRYSRTCDFLPEKTAERKRQLTMIYLKLFLNFLMIGALSFGGGYGMVSLVRETVISNGWLTESEFLNFIAVSESTPGPLAVNMATFIGSTQGGILGSFLATLGVVLPSFIIILLIAAVLKNLMKYAGVNAFLSGVRPCVIAMILATAIGMAISTLLGFTDIYSALAPDPKSILVFAILWLTHFGYKRIKKTAPSPIIMILFSAALGILLWGV
ncbi:MAG: chromate transporter, partial [Eubacteriales bacterium]